MDDLARHLVFELAYSRVAVMQEMTYRVLGIIQLLNVVKPIAVDILGLNGKA